MLCVVLFAGGKTKKEKTADRRSRKMANRYGKENVKVVSEEM